MKILVILMLVLVAGVVRGDWVPPSEPDPRVILNEASDDYRAENYKDSLAKHIWFHENALKYRESLYGVRLSFALSDWYRLAIIYPPALSALEASRDEAEKNVRNGVDVFDSFQDYRSINSILRNEERTVHLFSWLDKRHPDRAKNVYRLAEASLIRAKEYDLCGKYIDPDNAYLRYVGNFHDYLKFAKSSRFSGIDENFAYEYFSNSVSILVALLVINNRGVEAENTADMALLEWEDPEFEKQLERALSGYLPQHWL